MNPRVRAQEIETNKLLHACDHNGDGHIDEEEFLNWCPTPPLSQPGQRRVTDVPPLPRYHRTLEDLITHQMLGVWSPHWAASNPADCRDEDGNILPVCHAFAKFVNHTTMHGVNMIWAASPCPKEPSFV